MEKEKIDKVKQGRRNKAAGKAFEDRVYLDLEKKGWIVSRWMKNVEFPKIKIRGEEYESITNAKLIPAKPKIRMIPGKGPMLVSTWTGFPDFIAFQDIVDANQKAMFRLVREGDPIKKGTEIRLFTLIGVECKVGKSLDKEEKEKCDWLLKNNIFSKILIASKGPKRGQIMYEEFSSQNGGVKC